MGRSRYKIFESGYPYFITATVIEWLPLFGDKNIVSIITDSLDFLVKNNRIVIYGYVIMENHIHLIVSSENLSKEIADFKSFTARKAIDYLKEYHFHNILNKLEFFKSPIRTDRTYQFWQEGIHPEQIFSSDMLREKLSYIHNNPVKKGYVSDPAHWNYSSARNYGGFDGLIQVNMDWM